MSRRNSFSQSVKDLKRRFSRRRSSSEERQYSKKTFEDILTQPEVPVNDQPEPSTSTLYDQPSTSFDYEPPIPQEPPPPPIQQVSPAKEPSPVKASAASKISYEDFLKPVGGDTNNISSYNFPPPETAYSNIDVRASDAVFAEETQPVIKVNTGNIYDDPDYLKHISRLTEAALKPLLTMNGEKVDVQYICIAQAPQFPLTTDLFAKQHLINSYLLRVLNLDTTLYQLLHTTPGVSAPLYKAYVLILLRSLPNASPKFLNKINEAMFSMYTRWADQVPAMIELVLNTNGEDVMKEIMTVVNQSVYRIMFLLLRSNNIAGVDTVKLFAGLPFEQISDADFPDDQTRNSINNEQRIITNTFIDKYNEAVFSRNYHRYYLLPQRTPDIEVPYIPKIHINTLHMEMIRLFRLQRTPAELFDNPAYRKPVTNKVYVENVTESEA